MSSPSTFAVVTTLLAEPEVCFFELFDPPEGQYVALVYVMTKSQTRILKDFSGSRLLKAFQRHNSAECIGKITVL